MGLSHSALTSLRVGIQIINNLDSGLMHWAKDVVSIGLLCVLIWRISHFDCYKIEKEC